MIAASTRAYYATCAHVDYTVETGGEVVITRVPTNFCLVVE